MVFGETGYAGKKTLSKLLEEQWATVLAALATTVQLYGLLSSLTTGTWPRVSSDAAVFQHGGWFITQGAVPYVNFWDVKPPLIYYLTATLATLTGGDTMLLHFVGWVTSVLAITGTCLVIGTILYDLTGDGLASLAGGLALFAVADFYTLPKWGVYPQFFAAFLAALTILAIVRDRPLFAGVSGVLATGFYYPEGIVLVLVVGLFARRRDWDAVGRFVGGAAVGGGIVVAPLLYWGNLGPAIVETVLAPLFTSTGGSLGDRLWNTVFTLGPGLIVGFLATGGWFAAVGHTRVSDWFGEAPVASQSEEAVSHTALPWLIAVGGGVHTLRILVFGPSGQLLGWMVFAALGVGLAVAGLSERRTQLSVVLVVVLVLGGVVLASGILDVQSINPASNGDGDSVDAPVSMQSIYWGKLSPEGCHYRLSGREVQWIEMTDAEYDDKTCGKWPEFVN
jgi:hypothetical protein